MPQLDPVSIVVNLIVLVIASYFIQRDAKPRQAHPLLWIMAMFVVSSTFLFQPVALIMISIIASLYITFRPKGKLGSCPRCGERYLERMASCPHCGKDTKKECPHCRTMVPWHESKCPKCGGRV
ncbi:MAG: hypothetical protein M0Q40_05415 [Limnochordia bacterium]|nr:hypothetical protein [Limnochordia bacterium]